MDEEWKPIARGSGNPGISEAETVQLRGRHPKSDEMVDILGTYEEGGYTEGWTDGRGNTFHAEFWRPAATSKQ